MDMEKIDQLLHDASRKIHNEAEAKRQADAKEVYSRMEKIDFKLIEKLLSIRSVEAKTRSGKKFSLFIHLCEGKTTTDTASSSTTIIFLHNF